MRCPVRRPTGYQLAIAAKLLVVAFSIAVLIALTVPQQDGIHLRRGFVCVYANELHDGNPYICDLAWATSSLSILYEVGSVYVLACLGGVANLPGWRKICSYSSARSGENGLVIGTVLIDGLFFVLNMASFSLQLAGHLTDGDRTSFDVPVRVAIAFTVVSAVLTTVAMFNLARWAQSGVQLRRHARDDDEVDISMPFADRTKLLLFTVFVSSAIVLGCVQQVSDFNTPTFLPDAETDEKVKPAPTTNSTSLPPVVRIQCVFGESGICPLAVGGSVISWIAVLLTLGLLVAGRCSYARGFVLTRIAVGFASTILWSVTFVLVADGWHSHGNSLILLRQVRRAAVAVATCSFFAALFWMMITLLAFKSRRKVAERAARWNGAEYVWLEKAKSLVRSFRTLPHVPEHDSFPLVRLENERSLLNTDNAISNDCKNYGSLNLNGRAQLNGELPPPHVEVSGTVRNHLLREVSPHQITL